MAQSFERIFRDVPEDQTSRFQTFRSSHPFQYAEIGGTEWEYIACGGGERTLVVLPGGARHADVWFKLISTLEERYRLVVPTIPAITDFVALLDGLDGLLQSLGEDTVALLGTSFGGCIAQGFVRTYPGRVDKVIFSHTTVPDHVPTKLLRIGVKIAGLYPLGALRFSGRVNILQLMKPPPAERAFWKAYWFEKFSGMEDKGIFINPLRAYIQYGEDSTFHPDDLAGWPGDILILESDNDPAFKPPAREAMKAMYPQARVHTFIGAGHTPGYSQPTEYIQVLTGFLEDSGG